MRLVEDLDMLESALSAFSGTGVQNSSEGTNACAVWEARTGLVLSVIDTTYFSLAASSFRTYH